MAEITQQNPSSPQQGNTGVDENTIDEPVYTTFMRDLRSIGRKIRIVLIPRSENMLELKNWDLWGPLILCLILAVSLGITAKHGQNALVFAGVFTLVWIGAAVVTLNGQLLGGKISFFQSVCVLGYCIFPLVVCSVIFIFLKNWPLRLILVGAACIWSCFASTIFLSGAVSSQRKVLTAYPIILFYLFISWQCFVQN